MLRPGGLGELFNVQVGLVDSAGPSARAPEQVEPYTPRGEDIAVPAHAETDSGLFHHLGCSSSWILSLYRVVSSISG